jgi:hypothetical protein
MVTTLTVNQEQTWGTKFRTVKTKIWSQITFHQCKLS